MGSSEHDKKKIQYDQENGNTKESYCPKCSKVTTHRRVSKHENKWSCDDCGRTA